MRPWLPSLLVQVRPGPALRIAATATLILIGPAGRALDWSRFGRGCGCPEHSGRPGMDDIPPPGPTLVTPPPAAPVPPKPAAPVTPPPAPTPTAFTTIDGYVVAGFDRLGGFDFPTEGLSADAVTRLIPEEIRRLDGHKVRVRGFVLPVKMEQGRTTEFLLVSSPQLCCYGITPAPNQWMIVTAPRGVPPTMDTPVEFLGRLRVGADFQEGYLAGIYRLEAEQVAPPPP